MFDGLVIRGARASILWGYRTAAELGTHTITRAKDGRWILRAAVAGCDRFMVKQTKPALIFTAPRHYGMCCWPVVSVQVGETSLVATLGPPEQ